MDVTGGLLRFAAGRSHPFVVAAPGATAVRLAVERECRQRGWPTAASPAEADLLVACGSPGPSLTDAVDRVWEQMPAPRARVVADREGEVSAALHEGQKRLADVAGQRAAAAVCVAAEDSGGYTSGGGKDSQQDGGGDEEGEGGNGHAGHGAMSMPGGLDMAGRAGDRDGLALDVLHVPLGPVLPDWPCGLVIHTVLQGDVLQQADVRTVDAGAPGSSAPYWDEPWLRARAGETVRQAEAERRRAAAHLDSLGRLLAVAGWPHEALTARRLRDETLAGADSAWLRARFGRFARRLRRSRLLRWMTDGLGRLDAETAAGYGIGGPARRAGADVTSRWTCWLDECADALAAADDERPLGRDTSLEGPRGPLHSPPWPSRTLVDVLPRLLEGVELARARLVIASLDPDPDELVGQRAGAEVAGD